ncbi:endolytic transglycosylase MltG [Hazenella coriacea]|uniref:Endolytic murein transglycosylase n=1 Tax=Hazenella coriacea TaxID=1179467 RepID=A0A4R3L7G2_9BACL|nr:endolytic transglycosylase MltG [Hazenella coriacea]TCS94890.1 UPF0755 protein [Hazenella coriacea]
MKWIWRIIFTLLLLAGWGALAYMYANYTLESPPRDEVVTVEIQPKTSIKEIGNLLEKQKLIRKSTFFQYYVGYYDKTNLQAGIYDIQPTDSLDDMLQKFSKGSQDLVRVTIPEGHNVLQIAEVLEKKGYDGEGFLQALKDRKAKYPFEQKIGENKERYYRLEGYLFPSTYQFRKDEKPEAIVDAMLGQFQKQVDQLEAEKSFAGFPYLEGMDMDQWVTVASMVEEESQAEQEYSKIAGVIYNRLNGSADDQKLRIDATVAFAGEMQGKKGVRSNIHNERKLSNPYNSYLNRGLPPGPIANPGAKALRAALNPDQHKYKYYVTKSDCTNEHYFSETYTQHNKYIQQSNLNARNIKCDAK